MAASQFITGEAVALDLQQAALPSRLLAAGVDVLLQLALLTVLVLVGAAVQLDLSEAGAQALSLVTLVSVLVVYPVTFETLLRGRTPGKALLGLRVVRDDGGPIGFRQALVRGLSGAAIERPGVTLFLGGVITSLLNARGKRIGDLLAGTVVLRERVSTQGGTVAQMPPALSGWAATLDLTRLPDALAVSVRQFVSRSSTLTPAAREQIGGQLVGAVTDAVGPAPTGAPGWAVLAAVLAERRRREELRLGAARPAGSPTSSSGDGAAEYAGFLQGSGAYGAATPASTTPAGPPHTDADVRTDAPAAAGPGGFAAPT